MDLCIINRENDIIHFVYIISQLIMTLSLKVVIWQCIISNERPYSDRYQYYDIMYEKDIRIFGDIYCFNSM